MAKIHARRALDINPNDAQAKAVQARVEKDSSGKTSAAAKGGKGKTDGKGGGLFGLFGGKKKIIGVSGTERGKGLIASRCCSKTLD